MLVDVRSREAWDAGHVPGALHLPGGELADRLAELPPPRTTRTSSSTAGARAATAARRRRWSSHGRATAHVREMIGGFEYWAREGLAVQTTSGRTRREVDPLTGVPA